jgi:hypothetical protein
VNTTSIAIVPITLLAMVGILLIILGIFAGGAVQLVVVGLVPLALAGVLGVITDRRR